MNALINLRTPTTPAERIAYVRRLLEALYQECNSTEFVCQGGKCNTLALVYGEGDDWLQIIVQEKSTTDAWLKARQAL